MVQKEVAERICARPSQMSLISVSVQYFANPQIVDYVSREDFFPQPEVDSAILKIKPTNKNQPQKKPDYFLDWPESAFLKREKID